MEDNSLTIELINRLIEAEKSAAVAEITAKHQMIEEDVKAHLLQFLETPSAINAIRLIRLVTGEGLRDSKARWTHCKEKIVE